MEYWLLRMAYSDARTGLRLSRGARVAAVSNAAGQAAIQEHLVLDSSSSVPVDLGLSIEFRMAAKKGTDIAANLWHFERHRPKAGV